MTISNLIPFFLSLESDNQKKILFLTAAYLLKRACATRGMHSTKGDHVQPVDVYAFDPFLHISLRR